MRTKPHRYGPVRSSKHRLFLELGGTIRRLAHFCVQIADALLPFTVFAPLFVRQAHIGIQFQCLDLFPEKVDKLGLESFDRVFHTPPTQRFRLSAKRRANWDVLKEEKVAALFDKNGWRTVSFLFSVIWQDRGLAHRHSKRKIIRSTSPAWP